MSNHILGTFFKDNEGIWKYQTQEKENMSQDITLFCAGPLGNFHPSSFHDPKLSLDFKTSEQYFMLYKAITFGDQKAADQIMKAQSAYRAKMEGRSINGFDEYIWSNKKYKIMFDACLMKFSQNPHLNEFLQATNNHLLVETNPKDKVWSCGLSETDPRAISPEKWLGQNLLGKVLMEVRTNLAN